MPSLKGGFLISFIYTISLLQILLYNLIMKKFILSLILCAAFCANYAESSYAAAGKSFKLKIEQNKSEKETLKEIKALFDLQEKYTNTYNLKGLSELYDKSYIDNDGYTKRVYFKLIQDTWDTYPDITYKTEIKDVKVNGDHALVEAYETAIATDDEDSEMISAHGELYSTATCFYYLKKVNEKWVISAENVIEEKSTLRYGDARFVKMELNAPSLIAAGEEYTAELKIDLPEDHIVIASINKERIVQPVKKDTEVFKQLPEEQILERVFTSNTDNINEYAVASVGITKSEKVDDELVRVYMNGLAFIITRVNVVPKNNFVDIEALNVKETE